MTRSLSAGEADQLRFFHHRNRLLTAIREHSLCEPEEQSRLFIFQQCCAVLKDVVGCDSVWAGGIDRERHHYVPFASFPPVTSIDTIIQKSITETINARFGLDPVAFTAPISLSPGEPGRSGTYLPATLWSGRWDIRAGSTASSPCTSRGPGPDQQKKSASATSSTISPWPSLPSTPPRS